jgi:hypothetical protein
VAGGVWLAGNWALARPEADDDWAIPLLGDLHFDRPEHHDMDWLRREHPNDVRQVENYCRITRERTPRLLEQFSIACSDLQRTGKQVPLVLQLGDLLEGLCGNEQLAALHARDAIKFIQQARLPAPLLLTKGNHDVTGPGAAKVYQESLLPFIGQAKATFTQDVTGTLLVFYDAYDNRSLDWFAGLLEQHKPRRLIFAIHPPVVPYNARATWHIFSSAKHQPQRNRLLDLLGRHQALVLCGHLHKYSFLVRRTEHGRFTQLAISSVASTSDGRPRDELQGLKDYRAELVDLEPQHSPETIGLRRALLAAERPFIEHFEYADTWGHAILNQRGDRCFAEVMQGFGTAPWKTLDIEPS